MEVPCDLVLQSSSGETRSLAEQLEEASAVFTVWNRGSSKGLRKCFSGINVTDVHIISYIIYFLCE